MGHINDVKANEINVVVSVTSRSEHHLTKRFEELDVKWTIVEPQLVQWSGLFRDGKKLRIDLTFHYVEANESATGGSALRAGVRGRPSATQRMLTNRNAQVQAEEETLGRASVWAEVYRQMRCPGSCPLGPHCWRDPRDKQHYKLYTHHLQRLVKYVQDGARLQSQDNVPENIRRELYAEAEDVSAGQRTAKATAPRGLTPITINNHFPEQAYMKALLSTQGVTDASSTEPLVTCVKSPLYVSGYLDTAVRRYTERQQSRFESGRWKDEMAKVGDEVLEQGLSLDQVYNDQDFQFLVEKGIMRGIARRFVTDIKTWTKRPTCK